MLELSKIKFADTAANAYLNSIIRQKKKTPNTRSEATCNLHIFFADE